jgi:NAD(P)-dependent dehydrogenase (short-subunit alcohol dehydrogenase family)
MTWLVTGGSSGIGAALTTELLDAGQDVLVWDTVAPQDERAYYRPVDLIAPNDIEEAAQGITAPVHTVVHCAGVLLSSGVASPNLVEHLRIEYELHVVALARIVQATLASLVETGGSVVALASAAMSVIYPASAAYGCSKAAVERLVKQLAVELGPSGVRANTVAPGAVATPMTARIWADSERAAERRSRIPLRRQAEPAEVVKVIRFLASDEARYITGETVWVDGGARHWVSAGSPAREQKSATPETR